MSDNLHKDFVKRYRDRVDNSRELPYAYPVPEQDHKDDYNIVLEECENCGLKTEALKRAEQTLRNLANGFMTGESQTIARNEAANLRAAIE